MRRILKWVGIAVGILAAVVIALPFLVNANQFKPILESDLSTALNREVKLGNLSFSLLKGEVTADDLSVADDQAFGKPAFIRARSLRVGAEVWPFLFSRKLIVTYLTIDRPEIALVQSPSGEWNFSTVGGRPARPSPGTPSPGTAPLDLSVKLVRIDNGRLTLGRTVQHWRPLVLDQLNLELREYSATSSFPFTLSGRVEGGGAIQLNGKAGPINPTDSAMTPLNASLEISNLDLAASHLNDFAPDLAGLLSLTGSVASDGRVVQVEGKLKGEKLKFARNAAPATRPVAIDFRAQHDLRKHSGAIRQGDLHIGTATARLSGTYAEQGDSMILNLTLKGPAMPVPELEAMLPALGFVLPAGSRLEGGTATVDLSMQGPADKLVTTGSVALDKTRLAGFDLGKKMAVLETLAGIKADPNTEIETLRADVRVAPTGTDAQNIRLVVPAIGELSGAGTVSPARDLDFKMTAAVHTGGVLARVSDTPVPFTVRGACSDPVFRPDVKGLVKENVKKAEGELQKAAGGLIKGLLGGKK